MADWITQYSAALDARDAREKANKTYIDAYTKLADRTAALEATTPSAPAAPAPSPPPPQTTVPIRTGWTTRSPVSSPSPPPPTATTQNDTSLLARLRADLTSTQRTRSTLESQLQTLQSELLSLRQTSASSTHRLELLTREKLVLERRVRDRDEEVKQKTRLVENVHDEMAGLNLELNMAEQRAERLKGENEELVRRWMERMGEEAEKMNLESRWH